MTSQHYVTIYREQFASPGKVERIQLRPTSAHRRNNPQPQPDFLFPRSLKTMNKPSHKPLRPQTLPPVDAGRQPFPPVTRLSFNSPVRVFPLKSVNTVDSNKAQHMPAINPSALQELPSVDRQQKRSPPTASCVRLRSSLKSSPSGCYSCFHVVKPYQAGHYVIHPQFVSECHQ
ncbi:uncharacterized protein LOC133510595 [Syngnathoides biaculeatus]|uniref:uncharacterized protein LOC133510595 n=1 Tax=Syngnathoides biaculeatus TaxID=300417 RepID=UPI002ADDB6A6|nr:uncharacterized protein LOC133510595 [Syngnathoides biaculeatus]